jgi:multidrug efflux pump subunit AcrB
MIGIVMLVGIVKKNAIMMIDFAIERRRVDCPRKPQSAKQRSFVSVRS